MTFNIICADVIDGLRTLPSESINCVFTSPPYYCLRDYGVDGQIGLEPEPDIYIEKLVNVFREVRRVLHSSGSVWVNMGDSYCSDAGADREPTTLDGPRVPSGWTNRAQPFRAHALRMKQDIDPKRIPASSGSIYKGIRPQAGLKPKDLCMMPARVALALQADGWYLRCQIPWIKNCMPESVYDRPTSAIEYIYLLTKSPDYYYDPVAVLMRSSEDSHARGHGVNPKAMGPNSRMHRDQDPAHQTPAKIRSKQNRSFSAAVTSRLSTRARRNSDWMFSSIEDYRKGFQGLIVDGNLEPVTMLVNPQPFSLEMCDQCEVIYSQADYKKLAKACVWSGDPEFKHAKDDTGRRVCVCESMEWVSHFATFPERIVTPAVLASTSEHGCCEHCGAPYRRIVEEEPTRDHLEAVNGSPKWARSAASEQARAGDKPHSTSQRPGAHDRHGPPAPRTIGWEPTCSHPLFPCGVVPCVVLDTFSGSGRTGLSATKLNRKYIGIELNRQYAKMSQWQFEKLKAQAVAVSAE